MAKDTALIWVKRELDAVGVAYTIEHGGRHAKVRFTVGAVTQLYVCSGNANAMRSKRNSRAGIRRMLRQLGVLDPEAPRG